MRALAQQDQVRVFRRVGFWSLAVALLLHGALVDGSGSAFLSLSVLLLCGWPWLAESLIRYSCEPAPEFVWLPLLEGLLVSLLVLRCGFDLWQSLLTGAALLLCHLAQSGPLSALGGVAGMVLGVLFSRWLLPELPIFIQAVSVRDLVALSSLLVLAALVLLLAVAFTMIGYRRSVRLHRAKQLLQARGVRLAQLNRRLARYLPTELPARIEQTPELPLLISRRWVTVVFVDLCDFSTLAQRLEPEALQLVLNHYLAQLDRSCASAQASLSKVIGDGALLLFEEQASQSRALRAAQAIALCQSLPGMLGSLQRRWQQHGIVVALQLRCGVASGYCSVGDWGQRRLDYSVMGEAVNLAARLQDRADPGGVLLDEVTALLLDGRIVVEGPTRAALQGFGERTIFALPRESSVDRARRSAIVPSDLAVPAATTAPAVAGTETQHDRKQAVFAGRPGRTH